MLGHHMSLPVVFAIENLVAEVTDEVGLAVDWHMSPEFFWVQEPPLTLWTSERAILFGYVFALMVC